MNHESPRGGHAPGTSAGDIASATSGSTFHGLRSPTALVHSLIALLLLIAATILAGL